MVCSKETAVGALAAHGTAIDRIYHAPWHEEGEVAQYRRASIDRKPGPGMLLHAMAATSGKTRTANAPRTSHRNRTPHLAPRWLVDAATSP